MPTRARTKRRRSWAWLGLLPFFAFLFIFLLLPVLGVADKALTTSSGGRSFKPMSDAFSGERDAFWSSVRLSLISAALGAVLGTLLAYAAATARRPKWLRTVVTAFSGVAANMGGVVLAFAFLTLIGRAGVATKIFESAGYHLYGSNFRLSSVAGLTIVYLYFQIPLMLLVTLPAIDGLKPSWREASSNLGGTSWTYWRRVGLPVLTPVAARWLPPPLRQLVQRLRYGIRPRYRRRQPRADQDQLLPAGRHRRGQRQALRPGDVDDPLHDRLDGRVHPAQEEVRALDQVAVGNHRPPRRWVGRIGPTIVLVACGLFFVLPLLTMARYSFQNVPTILLTWSNLFQKWSFGSLRTAFKDPRLWPTLSLSLELAIGTVLLTLALLIPTALLVHLKVPKARPIVEFLTLLPYMVPPIALVAGVAAFFRPNAKWFVDSNFSLIPFYAVLALPFSYRAIDAGIRAIDVRTLIDASKSLGAGWGTTLWRVLLPNMRTAIVASSFLTVTVVLGELAIANTLLKNTFPKFLRKYFSRAGTSRYGVGVPQHRRHDAAARPAHLRHPPARRSQRAHDLLGARMAQLVF